jgi:hypothetical protein
VEIAEQLSIFLENKPGVLAQVCDALAEAGVNIRAMSISDTVDHAVVRLVTSNTRLTREVLERGGALVVATDVFLVSLEDRPGALAGLARRLGEAGTNIEYAYGSADAEGSRGVLVMRVDDTERAKSAVE